MSEIENKMERLWRWLREMDLEGVLISRRSNFAWLTGGADSHIFWSSESGACSLLIAPEGNWLVAHTMDGARTVEEQLGKFLVSHAFHHWNKPRPDVLKRITAGRRFGADIPTEGFEDIRPSWSHVVFPLSSEEIERTRKLALLADEALLEVCSSIRPGDSEHRIAARAASGFLERGMLIDVLLVGSDDRLQRYRHCLPTDKTVERHVLVHVAAHRFGLHANLTRVVHFGKPGRAIADRHQAVCQVFTDILSALSPGKSFVELLAEIKLSYARTGYHQHWNHHFVGGPSAYEACEPYVFLDPDSVMQAGETYDWLPSLPGAKVEETSLLTSQGAEILSVGENWPKLPVTSQGQTFQCPDILVL